MNQSLPTVCQVLHTLNVGGAEILAREYATNAAGEFNTVFACLDEIGSLGRTLQREGYVVEQLGRKAGIDIGVSRTLARFCRKYEVSVIHAHQYTPFFYASLSRFWDRRLPLVFTEHGRHFPDLRSRKRVVANRFLLGRNDRVVAVGNHVRDALVQNEGLSPQRIQVIYNGIDVDAFHQSSEVRDDVRQELGIRSDEIAVFQVARLNKLKDHATALRALQRLKHNQNIRLFLVGEGEERLNIQAMIVETGLQATVTLLGGRDDVSRLMNAADIFLLTSISEGIPLTLIEAMATFVPCVATDVGGVAEVVVDGETGWLAVAGDDAALASRIEQLATQREVRLEFGVNGRKRVQQFFSDSKMHAEYQSVYRKMLNRRGVR